MTRQSYVRLTGYEPAAADHPAPLGALTRRHVVPSRLTVPDSPVYVSTSSLPETVMIIRVQLAHHPARNAGEQNSARHIRPRQHHGASRDQRSRSDPGASEHDRAHPDERALPDVSAVNDRAVAKADPRLKHGRLTRIDMDTAEILDIAFVADGNLVLVGSQHAAVPDA